MSQRQNKSYEIDMCSGAILPKLLQFCMPLMFSSILQLLFHQGGLILIQEARDVTGAKVQDVRVACFAKQAELTGNSLP